MTKTSPTKNSPPTAGRSRPVTLSEHRAPGYVMTLATELRERDARYGVIGVCIGSGEGIALVLENRRAR